jgi:hypothetical protein
MVARPESNRRLTRRSLARHHAGCTPQLARRTLSRPGVSHAECPRGWFPPAVERVALGTTAGIATVIPHQQTRHGRCGFAPAGELLGHRTAQMTKRYAHLSVNHKHSAVERISQVPLQLPVPASGKRRLLSSCKQCGEVAEPGLMHLTRNFTHFASYRIESHRGDNAHD